MGTSRHIKVPYQRSASESTLSLERIPTSPVKTSQAHNQERAVAPVLAASPGNPSSTTAKQKAMSRIADRIAKVKEKLAKKEVDELSDMLEKKGPDKPAAWLGEIIEEVL